MQAGEAVGSSRCLSTSCHLPHSSPALAHPKANKMHKKDRMNRLYGSTYMFILLDVDDYRSHRFTTLINTIKLSRLLFLNIHVC